eukprot:TRINITY_DN13102_c0_g3_i1.p1 TRINITY_DN13102_c0_g3~~TRINITY_DN13102_c0_g3_i1.p1  ORF type:complete len:326 (+),score=81.35 TRINITY_DN13102_c0_g3_i1:142-978(+)
MAVFSVLGLGVTPSKSVSGAMQHFAAGILLSAVAQELVPPMVAAKGVAENVAALVGFGAGVAVMIVLGVLLPEPELEDEAVAASASDRSDKPLLSTLRHRNSSILATATCVGKKGLAEPRGETLLAKPAPPFPASFLTAVVIDGAMDGLLLGIASAASASAGAVLAISLAIEMSFLGMTLATSMAGQPRLKALGAVFLSPLALVAAASLGGYFAGLLATAEAFRIGLLAFGASALLFMTAEELLLEAHEDGGKHVWWVDIMLYVGFISSIYLSKFLAR